VEAEFRDGELSDTVVNSTPIHDTPNALLPCPRALLRRVLTMGSFGPGTRVLDVGCGLGHFARYLDSLGLDVTGLDSSESNIESARLLNPELEFDIGFVPREHFLAHNPNFDLIFARSLGALANGVWKRPTFLTISALIACLRSDGALVVEFETHDISTNRAELDERFIDLAAVSGPIKHEFFRSESQLHAIIRC
jgi:SAM-dependent methyltransferase